MGGLVRSIIDPIREKRVKRAFNDLLTEDISKTSKAMLAIRNAKHPLSLIACVNLLSHSYPEVRSEAEELIGYKKPYMDSNGKLKDLIYKKLAKLLVSDEYYVRESAVGALWKIRDPDYAVFCINRQLKFEKDISVITRLIDVLGRYAETGRDAETILRAMLKNEKFENYREEIRVALKGEPI